MCFDGEMPLCNDGPVHLDDHPVQITPDHAVVGEEDLEYFEAIWSIEQKYPHKNIN